jgi:putative FmdB family regulatory protein
MPTYEYVCVPKKHHFEKFQRITDSPVRKCQKCGGKAERLISGGAGVLFKGRGFYETDYRSADYRRKAKAECETAKSKPAACAAGACNKACGGPS